MLITTSRKPSQRTRSFGRALERVLPARYINRGKMSLRDVYLKAQELNFTTVMVISERNGNPSRLEFYNGGDEAESYLLISVDLSLPSGRVDTKKLGIKCESPSLDNILIPLFELEEKDVPNNNLLWIKKTEDERMVMEFYDNKGILIRPRIYLRDWKGVANGNSAGS
ncbi:MAG TPA: Brix domain-containing protein [Methanobacteriaceae archaeon]|nr:Brix domain-containing protein [Methanobacteriaceae archaeon]